MSLTPPHHGVISIHQDAINTIITAVANQRPRLFHYSSKISATTANVTKIDPIPYPAVLASGEPAVLNYEFHFEKIAFDLFPNDLITLPSQITPFSENQMILIAELQFVYFCSKEITILPDKGGRKGNPPPIVDIKEGDPENVELKLLIKFTPTSKPSEDPEKEGTMLGMQCLSVEIVDIEPEKLENFLECYIKGVVEISIIPQLKFFIENFTTKFFTLAVTAGPFVKDDRIMIFGDVLPPPGEE